MTKMIIGLGNPGKEYAHTKHNIGFTLLDQLADREKITFNKVKYEALLADFMVNGEKIILVKPQTYMNLSGRAVRPLVDFYKVDLEDILVVHDDLDLPIGKIRLRQKGSSGGQNGVKNIIEQLGTKEFNRLKIGIGRPLEFETVTQHVLSKFLGVFQADVDQSLRQGVSAIDEWIKTDSFIRAMNKFN